MEFYRDHKAKEHRLRFMLKKVRYVLHINWFTFTEFLEIYFMNYGEKMVAFFQFWETF